MTDQKIPAALAAPSTPDAVRVKNGVFGGARTLHPGYFALVMATGIVSSALLDAGRDTASMALLVLALICFAVLLTLLTIRVIWFRRELVVDLSAPDRAYSFFTFVAACGVLGSRLAAAGI